MGIAWREELAVGVPEIDGQHKELLKHFDSLLVACEQGKGIAELKQLLTFLDDYVVVHFRDEEALQRLRRYPGYEAHKREHESFVERLKALKAEVSLEGAAVHHVMETNNLLLTWLIKHISKVDRELGNFLKQTQNM